MNPSARLAHDWTQAAYPKALRAILTLMLWMLPTLQASAQPTRSEKTIPPQTPLRPVLPGPDGSLSAWAVLGPYPRNHVPGRLSPSAMQPGRSPSAGTWRIVARPSATWRMLGPKTRSRQARDLFAGLILEPRKDNLIRLSATSNCDMEILLDGRRVAERQSGRFAPDSFLVDLPLHSGKNVLMIRMRRKAPYRLWKGRFRFLSRDFRPLADQAALFLPAKSPSPRDHLRLLVSHSLRGGKLKSELSMRAPGGLIVPRKAWLLTALAGRRLESRIDPVVLARRGIDIPLARGFFGRLLVAAPFRMILRVPDRKRIVALWARAKASLEKAPAGLPQDTKDSLTFHLKRLERLLEDGDPDRSYLLRLVRLLVQWCDAAARGVDPFSRVHGRVVMARRSSLDGSLQPYSLWIPSGARRRKLPLYVMLHGMECSHRKGLNQMLGVWMPRDDPTPWSRFTRRLPPPRVSPRAIILAPQAFADSFYRHEGQVAVFEAIDAVRRRFRIDPDRIILVGHSMGGTGVLELGLKQPDLVAGMVSLSGYPSRWIYPSIRLGPLRPWERAAARTWSPILWVENGRQVPLIAVHGTRDHPERAQELVQAYLKAGGRARLSLFEEGHSVWRQYLADGRVFSQTRSWRRKRHRRWRFRTTRLRWHRAGPVSILGMDRFDRWAEVSVTKRGPGFSVRTKNVTRLALDTKALTEAGNFTVTLDGRKVVANSHRTGGSWIFERSHDGAWRPAKPAETGKRPQMGGPIDDIYFGPVLVVKGTKDPKATGIMDLLSAHLSRHGASSVRYPVIEDRRLTSDKAASANLILVGGPTLNSVTARLSDRLPIRRDSRGIHLGTRTIDAPGAAVLFLAPNPEHPDRYLLVLEGNTKEALVRALALPSYLPDWVVFDESIQKSGLPRILGPNRRFLAAGWFDANWRLPRTKVKGLTASVRPKRASVPLPPRNTAPRPGHRR